MDNADIAATAVAICLLNSFHLWPDRILFDTTTTGLNVSHNQKQVGSTLFEYIASLRCYCATRPSTPVGLRELI